MNVNRDIGRLRQLMHSYLKLVARIAAENLSAVKDKSRFRSDLASANKRIHTAKDSLSKAESDVYSARDDIRHIMRRLKSGDY